MIYCNLYDDTDQRLTSGQARALTFYMIILHQKTETGSASGRMVGRHKAVFLTYNNFLIIHYSFRLHENVPKTFSTFKSDFPHVFIFRHLATIYLFMYSIFVEDMALGVLTNKKNKQRTARMRNKK